MLFQDFIGVFSGFKQSGRGLLIVLMATLCLSACGGEDAYTLEERMERALARQSDGNLKAAVIELKNTLVTYPDSGDARFLLGRVYIELGMGFAAEKEIKKAEALGIDENITLFPLAESWLLQRKPDMIIEKITYELGRVTSVALVKRNFLGAAYLSKGDIKAAEKYFDEVLVAAPRNMRALVGKARINFFKKDTENMDKYVALAEAIHPNDRELLELSANRSWFAKDYEAAEAFYIKLVKHYPSFYINEIYLSWLEIINGKSEQAGKTLTKFRRTAPESILVNFVSALHAITNKNYIEAKTYAQKVLLQAPGDIRTKYIAAIATFALDENEQSFAYVQQYLRAKPDDLRARELLLQLQFRLKKNKEAYATLKDISNQAEKKEKFLNMLASYELKRGDIEQAQLYLEQSLSENPEQVASRQKLAFLKISEGDIEGGLSDMKTAQEGIADDYNRKMQWARALIVSKKYTDAIEACQELQEIDSANINGYLCEGRAQYDKGDTEKALPIFNKILVKEPGSHVASTLVAAIYLKNNDTEKAIEVQEQYLKVHPNDAKAIFGMYILKMKMDKRDEALVYLKKSVELAPNSRMAVLTLSRHYLISGKAAKALEISDKLMPLFPRADGLLEVRGKAQMILDRFGAAERSFEKLVKVKSQNVSALSLLASAYEANNDFTKLETTAQEILSLKPEDDQARIYLAKIEASRGKWQEADDILSKIKGDFSKNVEYSSLRGRINLFKKDYDKAIYFFDKSFQADKNIATLLQLATVYRLSGKVDSAIDLMEDWQQKNPKNLIATVSLGDYYLEQKSYKKANEKYNLILAKHPAQSAVLNNLAWSLYKSGQLDEALSAIRKARDINPKVAAFLDTEAEILLAQGEVNAAIRQYRKAADNAKGDLKFKYHLALALVQANQTNEAIEILKDLKLDARLFEGQMKAFDLLKKLTAE